METAQLSVNYNNPININATEQSAYKLGCQKFGEEILCSLTNFYVVTFSSDS